MTPDSRPPRRVALAAAFFVGSGILEFLLGVFATERAPSFGMVWDAVGQGLLHLLVGLGLWRRFAFCRSIALIYCIAAVATYATALVLAAAGQPLSYPPAVVVQSVFQIPSCLLLFAYLRSPGASSDFPRPVLGS